jgi:hypothetical protein
VRLDRVQGGSGAGQMSPVFQAASVDGSRVFFTDQQALTEDSGAVADKPDLYVCDIVEAPGGLACALKDLTPSHGGESAWVQSMISGVSQDGSWVYFVTNGVLGETGAEGARPGDCHETVSGPGGISCNLYVLHHTASGWEGPRLVTVLAGEDFSDWGGKQLSDLSSLTARVSPGGGWLAFMSARSLTGYDNHDALSGKPDQEVFIYHATTGGLGRLVCASCDPTGARPHGVEYAKVKEGLVGDNSKWNGTQSLAATLPGWTPYVLLGALYQSRYLSDAGRLFFNSSDALAPQDVNGNEDVYEWEPAGVGACTSASSTFTAATGGCVGLVSSGRAAGESAFIDASETGGDVFFLTGERLARTDTDTALDLYDAHVCTGASDCAPETEAPPVCGTADSCRAAPSGQPSIFGVPASATFSGPGNLTPEAPAAPRGKSAAQLRAERLKRALKACRAKRSKRKRRACEAAAHKRYGARSARSVGSGRRAGRKGHQ